MRLEDIQVALEAACKVSSQTEFVIGGSLSVLGTIDVPPEMMAMSIDIDFYPLRNPKRASEIGLALGENSSFHERHGFYLDPISPELPVLPRKWRDRISEVKLGDVTAFFMDLNDIAISKYARSADNDFRWISAGYEHGILDLTTIEARVRFETDFILDEDRQNVKRGLVLHSSCFAPGGVFNAELANFLQGNLDKQVRQADLESGRYCGEVLWSNQSAVVQSKGCGEVVVHLLDTLDVSPPEGSRPTIRYRNGRAKVDMFPKKKSLDLGL
ncbi:DUF6036 family nucleotidyltransferase [Azonexus sp.]|uniref:DUF6036 family nucleotidyltransferase n=1 Tax=Azonexus sp. TaxID=1872668 RepID=UPI0039E545C2